MFNYSEKTKVDIKFKMLDLFKTIKADKSVKTDASNVVSVVLSNTLSPERTNLEASENVKEIYVIDIILNSKEYQKFLLMRLIDLSNFKHFSAYISRMKLNTLVQLKLSVMKK